MPDLRAVAVEDLDSMPTTVYLYDHDGALHASALDHAEEAGPVVAVEYRDGDVRATPPDVSRMAPHEVTVLAHTLGAVAQAMGVIEQAHRLAAHHPVRHGLVPVADVPGHVTWQQAAPHRLVLATLLPDSLLPHDVDHLRITTGWFHPEADPTQFGTPYLVPAWREQRGAPRGDSSGPWWVLRTVGATQSVERYAWDDADGIAAAVRRTADDPELVATEHVLADAEQAANDLRLHTRRTHIMQARQAFAAKRDQVRPRLTAAAIDKAVRDFREYGETGWSNVTVHGNDLSPTDIIGYGRGNSVWAAYQVGVSRTRPRWTRNGSEQPDETETHAEAQERLARAIARRLSERDLGTVLTDPLTPGRIIVTQRPDLVAEFPEAFGLQAHTALAAVA